MATFLTTSIKNKQNILTVDNLSEYWAVATNPNSRIVFDVTSGSLRRPANLTFQGRLQRSSLKIFQPNLKTTAKNYCFSKVRDLIERFRLQPQTLIHHKSFQLAGTLQTVARRRSTRVLCCLQSRFLHWFLWNTISLEQFKKSRDRPTLVN